MKCKYEGTGVWAGRCKGTKEIDPCIGYEKCKNYKSNLPTNADRIRAMSDEALAEFICGIYDEENGGVYQDECGKFINGTVIVDYDQYKIAEWLKQPAETTPITADTCVCCGAIIPEGQMVCPNCLVTMKDGDTDG